MGDEQQASSSAESDTIFHMPVKDPPPPEIHKEEEITFGQDFEETSTLGEVNDPSIGSGSQGEAKSGLKARRGVPKLFKRKPVRK